MRRRWIAIVGLVVLVAGGGLTWWLTRAPAKATVARPSEPDPWAGEDTAALIAKKRATRKDAPADERPAALGGTVTRAADGAPVAAAVVTIRPREFGGAMFSSSGEQGAVEAITDERGAWSAPSVRAGPYVVSAAAAGLLPASVDVDVAPGASRTDLVLALAAGGTEVSGVVEDIGGGPIAGARVTVRGGGIEALGSSAVYVAVTGADGRYRLTLPDGSWHAGASHADYAADGRSFELRGRPLTVDFTLTPGGTIRGTVIARDTGRPVAGVRVSASGGHGRRGGGDDDDLDGRGSATSDEAGAFTLRGVGAGALSLRARGKGYASKEPAVVEVGIGEEVTGVRVTVERAFNISGFVVREGTEGEGIAGVRVAIFSFGDQDSSGFALAPSADDGYFEIVGVRPGRYMLAALGEGVMPELGQGVTVVDRDVTDVLVTMDTGATLSGKVEPAAVARLSLRMDLKEVGLGNMFEVAKVALVAATSDASGAFTLRSVPRGSFTLRAEVADGRGGELPVTVTDADQRGLVVRLEERGAISGRVIDAGGTAVGGVTVEAAGAKPDITFSFEGGAGKAVSAPDGSFRIAGLEPGTLKLTVSDEDGPLAWADPAQKAPEVTIEGTSEVRGVTLTVEARDGVIRGVVLGPDRQAVMDAWVTARATVSPWRRRIDEMKETARERSRDADAGAGEPQGRVTVRVEAGDDDGGDGGGDDDGDLPWSGGGRTVLAADGRFTITKLRRGTYTIIGEATKGALRGQQANVRTGESVTLVLRPLGVLTVAVTSAGAPVPAYQLRCRGPGGETRRGVEAADGTAVLERQPAGAYTCDASADAGTASGKVELVDSARLSLALAGWASITGVAVDEQGRPRPGLRVMAHIEGQDMSESMEDLVLGGGVRTDAAGRFEVGRLAAGKGSVMLFEGTGFRPLFTREVTLTAGQRLDLGTITAATEPTGDR